MSDKLVTIASGQAVKLYLYQSKLESEGIWSFIADESMVRSPARLQVKESDAEKAIQTLELDRRKIEKTVNAKVLRCPKCHSSNVAREVTFLRRILTYWITHIMLNRKYRCNGCGYEWKV